MNAQVPPTHRQPHYPPAPPPQLYHAVPQQRPYYASPPAQPYYPAPPPYAPPTWYPPSAYHPHASITYLPRQTSHGLHLFLTIVTGGAWGLVWLAVALSHRYGARQDVRTYHA